MRKEEEVHTIKMLCRLLKYNLTKIECLQNKGTVQGSALSLLLNDQIMLQSIIISTLKAYAGNDKHLLAMLDKGAFDIELVNMLAVNYIKAPIQE